MILTKKYNIKVKVKEKIQLQNHIKKAFDNNNK